MIRRGVAVAAVAAAVALALPAAASAHAYLVRSDPADGSSLTHSPRTMRLLFSEQVSPGLSRVELVGASGRVIPARVVPGHDSAVLTLALPRLPGGVYRIVWQTVSTDDLHATRGETVFGVGNVHVAPAAGLPPDPAPATGSVLVRWLDFAAVAALLGPLAMMLLVLPAASGRGARGLDGPERRLRTMALLAAPAALVTGIALLLVQASSLPRAVAPAGWTLLTGTTYGPRWALRELLLIGLLATVVALPRAGRRSWLRWAGIAMAVALCGTLALTGHAPAARGDLSVAVLAMTAHLLTAAIWTGGLAAAAICLAPLLVRDPHSGRIVLRCFGNLAAGCVALVAITGLYSAGVQVASADALLQSVYGRTLVVKSLLFLAVGALGLTNLLLLRRRAGGRRLRLAVALESAIALTVLVPAAMLTASAPARGPQYAPAAKVARLPALRYVAVDDLILGVSVKPNRPGANFASVKVLETRLPAPGPVTGVAIRWPDGRAAGEIVDAVRTGGTWRVPAHRLSRPGVMPLQVVVHRTGLPDALASLRWPVDPPSGPAPRQPWVSDRTLAPLLTLLAEVLLALAAAAVLWRALRPVLGQPPALAPADLPASE